MTTTNRPPLTPAERAERAESALAALRGWVQNVIDQSVAAQPGGQHVGPPKFNMTIGTRKELQRALTASACRLEDTHE